MGVLGPFVRRILPPKSGYTNCLINLFFSLSTPSSTFGQLMKSAKAGEEEEEEEKEEEGKKKRNEETAKLIPILTHWGKEASGVPPKETDTTKEALCKREPGRKENVKKGGRPAVYEAAAEEEEEEGRW